MAYIVVHFKCNIELNDKGIINCLRSVRISVARISGYNAIEKLAEPGMLLY